MFESSSYRELSIELSRSCRNVTRDSDLAGLRSALLTRGHLDRRVFDVPKGGSEIACCFDSRWVTKRVHIEVES